MSDRAAWVSLVGAACLALLASRSAPGATPDPGAVVRYAAACTDGTWKRVAGPAPNLSSRELFTSALALAEAGRDLDRLETLFDLGARMQDRAPESRGYGNFRWSWSHERVLDYNAVEFCMQGGALVWLRHRDRLPAAARDRLRGVLDLAAEGCLRHRVRPSYTNIALMNAENLILLGEALERPDVADEGYACLDAIVLYTWEHGIAEYGSPTYYGVDLDCLGLIEAFAARDRGRDQARALLELFWTDVALNAFPPSARLAGPHSRDYDYLRGHGVLDTHWWFAGWLPGKPRGGIGAVFPALARWRPPAALLAMSRTRFPRLVRQAWGPDPSQSRTHYLLPDVTLGSAGANYHNMDLPLTVDLPGDADFPRCYFIPDARHDPYGKAKIPEGSGAHSKTLHLRPFWAAAQRGADALALVLYREEDQTRAAATLESHFVVPLAVDAIFAGGKRLELAEGRPLTCPIDPGCALVLRKGPAAVGLRVVWARAADGRVPPVAFVSDANPHGVARLSVVHFEKERPPAPLTGVGAALWVRVGSGLDSEEAFDRWRRGFEEAEPTVQQTDRQVRFRVPGAHGPVSLEAAYPEGRDAVTDPPPARGVLELDGKEIGRPILERVEPVRSYLALLTQAPPAEILPGKGVYLEAEAGFLMSPMTAADDAAASGGRYVWHPGKRGEARPGSGRAVWRLATDGPRDVYLWARVLAPTPQDDSFFVAVAPGTGPSAEATAWHLGTHTEWTWVPFVAAGSRKPAPIPLPGGAVRLELRAREDGTKVDRIYLTLDPDAKPE